MFNDVQLFDIKMECTKSDENEHLIPKSDHDSGYEYGIQEKEVSPENQESPDRPAVRLFVCSNICDPLSAIHRYIVLVFICMVGVGKFFRVTS